MSGGSSRLDCLHRGFARGCDARWRTCLGHEDGVQVLVQVGAQAHVPAERVEAVAVHLERKAEEHGGDGLGHVLVQRPLELDVRQGSVRCEVR